MRSYTNKKGELVKVSQDHLDTALELKRQLQLESPSHRVAWSKHKKMMEKEGFFDSESSENYRLLIRNYETRVVEDSYSFDEVEDDVKYESKLESIKDAVGDLYFEKRQVQLENQKLGKVKRDLTLYGVIASELRDAIIQRFNAVTPRWSSKPLLKSTGSRMVVFLSDWHIGAVVRNVNGNNYNFKIAQKRIVKYFHKIMAIADENNISDIDVVCLGDITEHISMRKVNQAFETEFNLSVQITKAFELIKDFINNLSEYFNVTYRGVGGNHDRMNGDKDDNVDGDSTIHVINYFVKEFIENSEKERLVYIECDDINYSSTLSVNGVNMKFVHGDNEKNVGRILASHNALDGVLYNLVVMGHIHHWKVIEVGLNQFEVWFGSLVGMNNYGKKGKFTSNASQGIILIDEFGGIDIRRIDLQNS